jgi:bifunctional non-homologous end joining protein LigD
VACAFDLLRVNGDDMRRRAFAERTAALAKLLFRTREGIQYVEHAEGHGDRMFAAACHLGLEGIVSKGIDVLYRSGRARSWIKVKNPNAAAATRTVDRTF